MITYYEDKRMKPKQFIRLLLRYNHHFLAAEVCHEIGIDDTSLIFEDWAIKKLRVFL